MMKDSESVQAVEIIDDIELGQIVGGYFEAALETIATRKLDETLDDWANGHIEEEPDEEQFEAMMALATDACLFSPSMSGATPMSRFIASVKPEDPISRQALKALSKSEIRFVRIIRRLDPELVELKDCISNERLVLIDNEFSDDANGKETLLRLCRFDSGRYFLISFPFLLTQSLRGIIETYIRPGKGISNPYRCATAVYKHAVREGVIGMPHREYTEEELAALDMARLQQIAIAHDAEWMEAKSDPQKYAEFVEELREVASAESALSYLHLYSLALDESVPVSPENLREICVVMVRELVDKQRLASGDEDERVESLRREVSEHVQKDELHPDCEALLDEVLGPPEKRQQ
jgi:hypothetical protein